MDLRPYQAELIERFGYEVAKGRRRIIAVAPTGAGKTIIASDIIKAAGGLRRHVLVLAHRREIIAQTSRKLYDCGIRHGIIQAGFSPRPLESVQVASVQTLYARAIRTDRMDLPTRSCLASRQRHAAVMAADSAEYLTPSSSALRSPSSSIKSILCRRAAMRRPSQI